MSLTEAEELELLELEAEAAKAEAESNKERPWYSVTPGGLATVARGMAYNTPFSKVSEAISSGAQALYRGATEDIPVSEAYRQEMDQYAKDRKDVTGKLGIVGNIATAAPAAVLSGMTLPMYGATGDLALSAADIATGAAIDGQPAEGAASLGIMGGMVAAPGVLGAVGKGLTHLPARIKGVSQGAKELYLQDPQLVKSADVAKEIGTIAEWGKQLRQNVDNAKAELQQQEELYRSMERSGKGSLQSAADNVQAARDKLAKAMDEFDTQDIALKEQRMGARDVVSSERVRAEEQFKSAEAARQQKIDDLNEELRNPKPELIESIKNQLIDLREETSRLAKEQIDYVKSTGSTAEVDSGVIFDAARQARNELQIRGVDTVKAAPITALLAKWDKPNVTGAPLDAWEAVKLRQEVDDMINYDRNTGAYGGVAEAVLSGVRNKINVTLDNQFADYPELRKQIADLSNLQREASQLFGGKNIESAISRLGGKNTGRQERVLQQMSEATSKGVPGGIVGERFASDTPIDLITERLDTVQLVKDLKSNPSTLGTPELASAEQRLNELDRMIEETTLAKRKSRLALGSEISTKESDKAVLEKYLRDLQVRKEQEVPVFKGQVDWAEERAKRLGFTGGAEFSPTKQAESVVTSGMRFDPESQSAREQLTALGTEMLDPMIHRRVQAAGARREIFDTGGLPTGTSGAAMAKQGISIMPELTVAIPLDIYRYGSKIANTKYAKVINEAYQRGGSKAVAVTHFLLSQTDQDYNEMVNKED